jgi:heme exporter protein C
MVMVLAFTLLFVTLLVAAMRNEILRRRVRALQMMQARGVSGEIGVAPRASQPA